MLRVAAYPSDIEIRNSFEMKTIFQHHMRIYSKIPIVDYSLMDEYWYSNIYIYIPF